MNKRAWILIVIFLFMFVSSAFALEMSDNGADWNAATYNEKVGLAGYISVREGNNSSFWMSALNRYHSSSINIGNKIRLAVYDINNGEY